MTQPDDLDLATLVARAQDGDLDCFERLVDRYSGPVLRLAFRMLEDRAAAEDVVQDTFVTVWRRFETLNDPAAFPSWTYNIATNRCFDLLRARRRRPEQPAAVEDLDTAVPATVHDPQAAAEIAAGMRDLGELLQQLPADQRACWLLREIHQLSYDEIASTLGVPASTVRGRIARARRFLADKMDDWR